LILPERHPACRRREARLGSGMERENLTSDAKGKRHKRLQPRDRKYQCSGEGRTASS